MQMYQSSTSDRLKLNDMSLYRDLVETVANPLWERSGRRQSLEWFRATGLRGALEGLHTWDSGRSGQAFEAHMRRAIRLEVLDRLRAEPQGLEMALDLV